MADVEMPQLGETVTEGTITKWFKAVGDQVAADEVLFEVSTDKVDSEVPSPAGGVLTEILVPEGETVDVGTKLAVIGDAAAAAHPRRPRPRPSAEPEPAPRAEAPPAAAPPAAAPPPPPPPPPPPAPAAPAAAPPAAAPAGSANGSGGGLLLSPVVRKLINEHGLDPATITGTGAGGRITRSDVLARRRVPLGQRACAARPRRAPGRAAPQGARGQGARSPPTGARGPRRRARHVRALQQHPPAHRRAHGHVQGRVGPRAHRHRGRLRGRRAGPPGPRRGLQGRRGLHASPTCRSSPWRWSTRSASSRTSTPRWATAS